jgi:hypothetical protein
MIDRRQRALHFIDAPKQRGLEFGPLDRPIVRKVDAEIYYVDHLPKDGLCEKYLNVPGYDISNIVDIDFVWGDETLSAIVEKSAPFDYIIASHVIEHVPDVIGWLNEICDVLKASGIISLIIPDKRFTFDFYRPITSLADLVSCHLEKRRRPSARQIFEAYLLHASVDVAELWKSSLPPKSVQLVHDKLFALKICQEALDEEKYCDVHCSVFTPQSFYHLVEVLFEMKLIKCSVETIYPTQPNEIDFFASLKKR